MHLVNIEPSGFFSGAISCNAPPHLVLEYKHGYFLQAFSKLLDVETDDAVLNIHLVLY